MKGYEANSMEREMIKMHFAPGDEKEQESVVLTAYEIMKELQEHFTAAKLNVIKVGKELKALGFNQRSARRGVTVVRVYDCMRLNIVKKVLFKM
jgi:hypothetical protein